MLSAFKSLNADTLKIGHIVKVKGLGDSPFMRVVHRDRDTASCFWFDEAKTPQKIVFAMEHLQFVENPYINPDLVVPETRGIYAACRLTGESEYQLTKWMARIGIPNPVTRDNLHITTVYSRKPFEYKPQGRLYSSEPARCASYDKFDNGQALVMKLTSQFLHDRFNAAMEAGATYDYPVYIPHLTLSYTASGFDVRSLPPYNDKLFIGEEYSEFLEPEINLTKGS